MMNPNDLFQKWCKATFVAIPVLSAADRCAMVDTFDIHLVRQVTSGQFSPALQKSVINKASKRLKDWPRDGDNNYII